MFSGFVFVSETPHGDVNVGLGTNASALLINRSADNKYLNSITISFTGPTRIKLWVILYSYVLVLSFATEVIALQTSKSVLEEEMT